MESGRNRPAFSPSVRVIGLAVIQRWLSTLGRGETSFHHGWNALRLALLRRCDQADQCFSQRPQGEEAAVQWAQQVQHAFESIVELSGWLDPIQQRLTIEKVMAVSDALAPETLKQFIQEAAGSVGRASFGKFGNCLVPEIMETKAEKRPCRASPCQFRTGKPL
jgi:hypothetical protein